MYSIREGWFAEGCVYFILSHITGNNLKYELEIVQYLQPSKKHLAMQKYYTMEEFAGEIIVSRRRTSPRVECGASKTL
jgi:lipoate synthase